MKKVLFSLASAVLLLSSCGSDEDVQTISKSGDLVATISFEGITPKAASSTAIPVTGWSNVDKVQMFLYNATTGSVAFSAIIDPATSTTKKFTWTNVPTGTYELALVANVKNGNNIATSLDGGVTEVALDAFNVKNKKLNADIFFDLKKTALPSGHTFGASKVGYAPTAEVFTAYASAVKIEEGKKTDLSVSGPLKLKREISLMRLRIDKRNKPESAPELDKVNFAHADNFIVIEKLPVGLGLKLGSFAGGIYATPSDEDRVMVGATGTGAFKTADPTTGYDPKVIIDSKFTLWQDIRVLPNATRADGKAASADADAARRYSIIIAGWVPKDYVYADGKIAQKPQPVYWSGTVKGVFSPNVIREVNMTINSRGLSDIPVIKPEGGLIIEVGAPENWNSNIETEDLDV